MVQNEEDVDSTVSTDPREKESRTWGMLCHLAAIVGFIIPFPVGNVLGPLVVWLVKREEFPFVEEQGKEALNFQISMSIYMAVAGLITCFLFGIGYFALVIADVVLLAIAASKASRGESYRYPLAIRFIK